MDSHLSTETLNQKLCRYRKMLRTTLNSAMTQGIECGHSIIGRGERVAEDCRTGAPPDGAGQCFAWNSDYNRRWVASRRLISLCAYNHLGRSLSRSSSSKQ
ncbi:hypothetical protein CRG98_017082 [Punica granatum]|uniref:Uncharacterized protein n=1 Tax=Punica granatum TaxID=22663 RepID=A0A2I0K1M9_PUNGR|nr:hypothetical protein CRG98_017082 [Punica granatum]